MTGPCGGVINNHTLHRAARFPPTSAWSRSAVFRPFEPAASPSDPYRAGVAANTSMKEVICMFGPKRILVPTDFTDDSDRALREAIDLAAASRGKVYLLHVDEKIPLVVGEAVLDADVVAATERSDERLSRQQMAEEVRRVASGSGVEIEIDERHGVSFEEIALYIRDKLIDLVVIGPHARKGLLKGLQVSVTERLMKEAACPMLILPSAA